MQRTVGNAAASRLLSRASADVTARLQRQIVGPDGEDDFWRVHVARLVEAEKDRELAQAIFLLHASDSVVRAKDYQGLSDAIKKGEYRELIEAGAGDADRLAAARLFMSLSGDYGAALSGHPRVAKLWSTDLKDLGPAQAGVREVLETFLFLYTNAGRIAAFFSETPLTERVWGRLEPLFVGRLGCGVAGGTEMSQLAKGQLKPHAWLTEGLDAVEGQLAKLEGDSEKRKSYIAFNLDNSTKAYFRKLDVAKDPPGGLVQSQRPELASDAMGTSKSAAEVRAELFFRQVTSAKSKDIVMALVLERMKSEQLTISDEVAMKLLEDLPLLEEVKPTQKEMERYIESGRKPVDVAQRVPLMQLISGYRPQDAKEGEPFTQQQALGWRKLVADLTDAAQIRERLSAIVLVSKEDGAKYLLVGIAGLNFDLKKAT